MSTVISRIVAALLLLSLVSADGSAQRRRRQRERAPVNQTEKKVPAAVDNSVAEDETGAVLADCEASLEKPKPEVLFKAPVLCGKAISLPKPAYPAEAKAAKVSGIVSVSVVTDERGRVIWARAISGHTLLQPTSVRAACRARYSPTLLSGRAVKTETVITYNFVAQ